MEKNLFIPVFIFISTSLLLPSTIHPQELGYDYLIALGEQALSEKEFEEALHYFKLAQLLSPHAEKPLFYINFIKRIKEGRIEEISPYKPLPEDKPSHYEKEKPVAYEKERTKKITSTLITQERRQVISDALDSWTKIAMKRPVKPEGKPQISKVIQKTREMLPTEREEVEARTLYLTDELFTTQPKTLLELFKGEALIIEAKIIKRYLVINPEIIDIERMDEKRILVKTKRNGMTFLHIWERDRRWTFNVKVSSKVIPVSRKQKEKYLYGVEPFKFFYNAERHSYYRGETTGTMEKESLGLDQSFGFYGETPYGDMDSLLHVDKLGSSMKLTNYTLGLTDGEFLGHKNINLRAFDIYQNTTLIGGTGGFSDLSYPGELLHGVSLRADVLNENLRYALVWGKEKEGLFGFISPGIMEERDSYIEGVRLQLFPAAETSYAVNFAHGYGPEREEYLKDNVYSVEIDHERANRYLHSELATDGHSVGSYLNSGVSLGKANIRLNFRNIEKDFNTIVGSPGGRGEIGALAGLDLKLNKDIDFSSELDVYRDRLDFNEGKKRKPNYDWRNKLRISLDPNSSWSTRLYYVNEPGISFPRRYLSMTNTYSTSTDLFGDRSLYTQLGSGYQRSRNPLSPSSDYDVNSVFGNFRLNLMEGLSCYINYKYGWLQERLTKEKSTPAVLETGIDFRKKILPQLTSSVRLYYRDEKNTSLPHSFLAGEDSLEGALHLTYTPVEDMEFFLDGRMRNIWAEDPDAESYIESEVWLGMRCAFDTFFRWNPQGKISGIVFKDANNNGIKDESELPLGGIRILIGKKEVATDEEGCFSVKVRAKRALVSVKPESLPAGYILTTPAISEVTISEGQIHRVNFGATVSSSISGVVYYDINSNGKLDPEDTTIPRVKISAGEDTFMTDLGGRYYFRNLQEGEYLVMLDINSLPLEYIPTVALKKSITIVEGTNYIYNIPLKKKIEEKE